MTQPQLSKRFDKASTLPTGKYKAPESLDLERTVFVGDNAEAVTTAAQEMACIGTYGYDPCLVIILHNPDKRNGVTYEPEQKIAALSHIHAGINGQLKLNQLINAAGYEEGTKLNVHLIGGFPQDQSTGYNGDDFVIGTIETLLEAVENDPNLKLKTFDVFNRPKPSEVAIDAKTGKLYRGTDLRTHALRHMGEEYDDGFSYINSADGDFDARAPG